MGTIMIVNFYKPASGMNSTKYFLLEDQMKKAKRELADHPLMKKYLKRT